MPFQSFQPRPLGGLQSVRLTGRLGDDLTSSSEPMCKMKPRTHQVCINPKVMLQKILKTTVS